MSFYKISHFQGIKQKNKKINILGLEAKTSSFVGHKIFKPRKYKYGLAK
jgi:hypothetical protein